MLRCQVCQKNLRSLTSHLNHAHGLTLEEYRKEYSYEGPSEDRASFKRSKVKAARRPADYSKFEGSHPMRDPQFLEFWKMSRSLGTYNLDKARETWFKKTGFTHPSKNPDWVKENVKKIIDRHGALFGGVTKAKKELPVTIQELEELASSCTSLTALASKLGVGEELARKFLKENGLNLSGSSKGRIEETPRQVVTAFLEACDRNGSLLSFKQFATSAGTRYLSKLKRIFAPGSPYADLLESVRLLPCGEARALLLSRFADHIEKANQFKDSPIVVPEGFFKVSDHYTGNSLEAFKKVLLSRGLIDSTDKLVPSAYALEQDLARPIPKARAFFWSKSLLG